MRTLPNTTGPVSYGETSWETGDTPEASTGKSARQELIWQANTVPLTTIFKHYNVRAENGRANVACPFKSHKGGRESTGSFRFYPATNSFMCYGCKIGGQHCHGVEFIAAMEGLGKEQAALRILNLFSDDVNLSAIDDFGAENFSEKFQLMMDFSCSVRDFRSSHFDEKAQVYIEKVCAVYDTVNFNHKLDNEALKRVVEELKAKINSYKP